MSAAADRARLAAAVATLRAWLREPLERGLIAGSGLSGLAEGLEAPRRLDFAAIPGWPLSTVEGHAGTLIAGRLGGRSVLVCAGRAHLYEGYDAFEASFNVRVMAALGLRSLVVTNAAGALHPDYGPGDLMLIEDHIYLPGLAGLHALRGPNDADIGPRFPVMAGAYDPALRARAGAAGREIGLRMHEGVYAMVAGPSFESPAEARFLRAIGADAVGMSTVPEVVVARHAGIQVLGISLITNRVQMANPSVASEEADLHAEVNAVGQQAAPRLAELLTRVLAA
ncbi:MAG: purine-nucleoside phosphorylase [Caldilineae bacterium]|nr:purine-nucleoside phosphorylase [Caldilineae bacterium]